MINNISGDDIFHFIGIGGIGMSGIAEILCNLGHKVQGSDIAYNSNIQRLLSMGINVAIGHAESNLKQATVVVVSSAVPKHNPELLFARAKRLPVIKRAEMLAELMRFKKCVAIAGSHGKTTTTSLVASIFDKEGLDPTVINGGIINAYGVNARLGAGDWMVVEADESDGSFLKLPTDHVVITNIDHEHLDYYPDFPSLEQAFADFVGNLPFYGSAVICLDNAVSSKLARNIEDRKVITYGKHAEADVRYFDLHLGSETSKFSVEIKIPNSSIRQLYSVNIPVPGEHNVQNATAAIAVASNLGFSEESLRYGISSFKGVKRRFTFVGEYHGAKIFDDYGHHPAEIAVVLRTARKAAKSRVIAIVQPHRYTRLRNLFTQFAHCFDDADQVYVADVYSAGETPIEGINNHKLVEALHKSGHKGANILEDNKDLPGILRPILHDGDYVVFLGAGSITQWANALPQQLQAT